MYKASVDGATNHLYTKLGTNSGMFVPDLISGDFDSVFKEVLEYYKNKVYIMLEDL